VALIGCVALVDLARNAALPSSVGGGMREIAESMWRLTGNNSPFSLLHLKHMMLSLRVARLTQQEGELWQLSGKANSILSDRNEERFP
jgi:hypothetical protein